MTPEGRTGQGKEGMEAKGKAERGVSRNLPRVLHVVPSYIWEPALGLARLAHEGPEVREP